MSLHSDNSIIINFYSEEVNYELENAEAIVQWLLGVYHAEQKSVVALNYIFCSDIYLLHINKQYLLHDTLTDIITFSNARNGAAIEGDIFISIERVKENALEFGVSFEKELLRVLVHGSLHLLGYKDKTAVEKKVMTQKEDFYLNLFLEI